MEPSVTTAPRELSPLASARAGGCVSDCEKVSVPRDALESGARGRSHSQGRRKQQSPQYGFVGERACAGGGDHDENDDDGESQLVICDTDDSCPDAPPLARQVREATVLQTRCAQPRTRARWTPIPVCVSRVNGGRPIVVCAQRLGGGAECESGKAAVDTGVVCIDDDEGDNIRTPEATVGAAGVAAEGSSRGRLKSPPTTLSSVRGSSAAPNPSDRSGAPGEGVHPATTSPSGATNRKTASSSSGHHVPGSSSSSLYPWPASLSTPPSGTESPDVVVVKEEPNDLSVSGRTANLPQQQHHQSGLEPLDLSVKGGDGQLSINYSSSARHVAPPHAEEDTRSKERERRGAHGSDSNSSNGSQGGAGTSSTSSRPRTLFCSVCC
ncbi:hypothetical protein HPB52_024253 [Rhipicephalus sanguineus]|uniref:Uncharacterized protein n=1 Tax=Rhipicephalus sanguineus TaxID=34632 RepID=A0A9D4TCN9_RHISA|nr:hypothetical protein HPB52_024253 [Rhipicephalus sanguineus]